MSLTDKGSYFEIERSGTMWDGYKFGRPGLFVEYLDDFTSFVTDEWTSTLVEAGAGESTITLSDVENGGLLLTCDANENDGINLQRGGTAEGETTGEAYTAVAGKKLFFETTIQINDVTQTDVFVGLHVEDTTIIAGRGTDYIGFRTDDGDASLDIESAASSSASDSAAVATLSDATDVKLGFRANGTDSVEFFVNDALVGTISSDIPTALMKPSIAILTGEAVANTMLVKNYRIAKEV